MNTRVEETPKTPTEGTFKLRLEWMNVLRLLCAVEIVGFHWLRAAYKLGAFGCPGSLSPVTSYSDTGLGWKGLLLATSAPCGSKAFAVVHAFLAVTFGYGWEAVNLFILISGFVLSFNLADQVTWRSWGGWYRRRLKRILLPYYEAALPLLTLFLLIVHLHAGQSSALSHIQAKLGAQIAGGVLPNYLKHVFLLDPHQRQWIASFCAPAWWFIPAILVAYLCFPIYVMLWKRLGNLLFLGLALGISVLSYRYTQRGILIENAWYYAVTNEAFSLALGTVAGSLWKDPGKRLWLETLFSRPVVVGGGVLLVVTGNLCNDFHRTYPLSSAVFTSGLAIVGIYLSRLLANYEWMATLAKVDAFRIYLIHQPFAAPLVMLLSPLLGRSAVPLGLPLYLCLSFYLARLLERADFSANWLNWARSRWQERELGSLRIESAGR